MCSTHTARTNLPPSLNGRASGLHPEYRRSIRRGGTKGLSISGEVTAMALQERGFESRKLHQFTARYASGEAVGPSNR